MTTVEQNAERWVPELTFGAKLALIRHKMGWNIKEAAVACGIRPQSWRGWELEGRTPHDQLSVGRSIAERTGVDLDWLLWSEVLEPRVGAKAGHPAIPDTAG